MHFLRSVREEESLIQRVKELGDHATMEKIAALGRESGYDFQIDELRAAHSRDWSMRLLRYASPHDASQRID